MAVNDDDLASYGKGFETIEDGEAVSKKPLSIENQIVTDEKGRRRFHGAFTGGFSAGHFNTVGSIEGWTPSTFVSNRSARADKQSHRPEDFMDKEDLGEYGIAPRKIQTTKDFTENDGKSSGTNEKDRKRQLAWEHTELAAEADRLADLIKPISDSIGVQMLKKMGWRPGKGIGPLLNAKMKQKLITQKTSLGEAETDLNSIAPGFKFAPEDVDFHVFQPKSDMHGLGYSGLDSTAMLIQKTTSKETALKSDKKQKKGIQGQAFGVGAFEEDDEDVYGADDLTKYDFVLGGNVPSRLDNKKDVDDDFEPSKNLLPPKKFYPPPKIVRDYVPYVPFAGKSSKIDQNWTKNEISSSSSVPNFTLNPVERASQLGESHSVWALVSESDRQKIDEIKSSGIRRTEPGIRKSRFDRKTPPRSSKSIEKIVVESIDRVVFPDDSTKQARYEEFLNYIKRGLCMPQPFDATDWEWESEQDEFRRHLPQDLRDTYADAKSRQKPLCQVPVAQPFAFLMKSKFTHAKFDEDAEKQTNEDEDKLKAVQLKMFGAMTREKHEWHPHRNLCKRFNLPNPYPESRLAGVPHFQKESKKSSSSTSFNLLGDSFQSTSLELSRRQAAARENQQDIERRKEFRDVEQVSADSTKESSLLSTPSTSFRPDEDRSETRIELENEEERPPMDLFRAVFADSGESSEGSDVDNDDAQAYVQPNEPASISNDADVIMIEEKVARLNNSTVFEPPCDFIEPANHLATSCSSMATTYVTQLDGMDDRYVYGPALPEMAIENNSNSDSKKKRSKKNESRSRTKSKKRTKKHSKKSSSKSKRRQARHKKQSSSSGESESNDTSESES